jgi:Ras-related protein Rab-2A
MTDKYIFKYIVIGDSGVGKTSIIRQFKNSKFDYCREITIGVSFDTYTHTINNDTIKVHIWDTAGQESFRSITRQYYRNSTCAFVVFDITNANSFKNVKMWVESVQQLSINPTIRIILIGNKDDISEYRTVSKEEAIKFAKDNNIDYFEISAKSHEKVVNIFIDSIEKIYKDVIDGIVEVENSKQSVKSVKFIGARSHPPIEEKKGYCYCY